MTRAEKVAEAQRLRAQGLLLREIAERMGVRTKTVHAWLSDPDRSREIARKRSYGGKCERCGAQTDGTAGPGKAPRFCGVCAPDAYREWTQDSVVEAIRRFHGKYGRPPSAADWHPALARARKQFDRAERYERDGCWPSTSTVFNLFGSWTAAIEAAGFSTRSGHWLVNPRPGDLKVAA